MYVVWVLLWKGYLHDTSYKLKADTASRENCVKSKPVVQSHMVLHEFLLPKDHCFGLHGCTTRYWKKKKKKTPKGNRKIAFQVKYL